MLYLVAVKAKHSARNLFCHAKQLVLGHIYGFRFSGMVFRLLAKVTLVLLRLANTIVFVLSLCPCFGNGRFLLVNFMDFTAIIKKGEKQFVALCPEVDVVSQWHSVKEALANLKEAVELHIEEMGFTKEAGARKVIVTSFEVKKHAKASEPVRV